MPSTSARTKATASCACSGVALRPGRAREAARPRRLLGRGAAAGAARQDRLVAHAPPGQPVARPLLEAFLTLVAQLALGVPAPALALGPADAQDRRQPRLERR